MKEYIISLDQSTSGTKVLLINKKGSIISNFSMEHKQIYPNPGWLEHDPIEIYNNCLKLIHRTLKEQQLTPKNIAFLSITNQRETAVIWDQKTSLPIYPAIVWQCRRTLPYCMELSSKESFVREKTGLKIDPYFSATKWKWIVENIESSSTNLLAGTIDSWLIYQLTKGKVHATDYTNASRTLLFNIHQLSWDPELINLFNLQSIQLPKIKYSDDFFGYIEEESLIEDEYQIPIYGVMGDSQAAMFAQQLVEKGMAKATYGTGSSVLMNIGNEPIIPKSKSLVLALGWNLKNDITYALEGIIVSSGDTIKWARDQMGLFSNFDEFNKLTQSVSTSEGVYIVPGFNGLGAPYWNPNAKACIVGISRSTTKAHLLKACLDAVALQIYDCIQLIEEESNIKLSELCADGGASTNEELMQLQADCLQTNVKVTTIAELSAFGATYAGALGCYFWTRDEIKEKNVIKKRFTPSPTNSLTEKKIAGWKKAVSDVNNQYQ